MVIDLHEVNNYNNLFINNLPNVGIFEQFQAMEIILAKIKATPKYLRTKIIRHKHSDTVSAVMVFKRLAPLKALFSLVC